MRLVYDEASSSHDAPYVEEMVVRRIQRISSRVPRAARAMHSGTVPSDSDALDPNHWSSWLMFGAIGCVATIAAVGLNLHASQPQPKLSGLIVASQQEPVRIRTKGLLERRGSSTSLTLDLNADATYTSPPRECSAEDYLSSAGNRMTRRQLRVSLNNINVLHQEFLDIPLNHPSKSSQLPGCAHRNRYKSIWPNEKTRVVLRRSTSRHENEGAIERSYINANYIRGYDDEPMAFIATQGPLEHTIEDFWLMCWQEKTPSIVMMTKLKEKNKDKCCAYLPSRAATYGDIHVEVTSCQPANGYYIRDVVLTHKRSAHKRYLKHFWYTSWPDQSAPIAESARQLIELATDVQAHKMHCRQQMGLAAVGPVVVHCSAGIGRTGCFIAICIGMRQLSEENMIDVLGIVCQMRLDRGGMIQTPDQYEFVHRVLAMFEAQLVESPCLSALPSTVGGRNS